MSEKTTEIFGPSHVIIMFKFKVNPEVRNSIHFDVALPRRFSPRRVKRNGQGWRDK